MLGKLAVEAGFPPGLIQVLSGYGPTVGATLARVRLLDFFSAVVACLTRIFVAYEDPQDLVYWLARGWPAHPKDVERVELEGSYSRTVSVRYDWLDPAPLLMRMDDRGGKSPTIVFPDADLPSAAKQLAHSILMYSGQSVRISSLSTFLPDLDA